MPIVAAQAARRSSPSDERDAVAVEDRGEHVAALLVGAEQEQALAVGGPERCDPRVHQLQLRRIERSSAPRDADAKIASRKNSTVMAAATMVSLERRNG